MKNLVRKCRIAGVGNEPTIIYFETNTLGTSGPYQFVTSKDDSIARKREPLKNVPPFEPTCFDKINPLLFRLLIQP